MESQQVESTQVESVEVVEVSFEQAAKVTITAI